MFSDGTKIGRIQFTPQFASAGFIWSHLVPFGKRAILRSSGPHYYKRHLILLLPIQLNACDAHHDAKLEATLPSFESVLCACTRPKKKISTPRENGVMPEPLPNLGPHVTELVHRKLSVRIRPPLIAYRKCLFPFIFTRRVTLTTPP